MRTTANPVWALVLIIVLLAPHAGGMVMCICADGNRVIESACDDACPCDAAEPVSPSEREPSDDCGTCTKAPITAFGAASAVAPQLRVAEASSPAAVVIAMCSTDVEHVRHFQAGLRESLSSASHLARTVVIQV